MEQVCQKCAVLIYKLYFVFIFCCVLDKGYLEEDPKEWEPWTLQPMERGETYLHIGSHELVEATHVTSNLTFQVNPAIYTICFTKKILNS